MTPIRYIFIVTDKTSFQGYFVVTTSDGDYSVWLSIGRVLDETAEWGEDGFLTAAEYVASAIDFANTGTSSDVIALLSGSAAAFQIDRETRALPLIDVAKKDHSITRLRFRESLEEIVDTSAALRSAGAYSRGRVIKKASIQLRAMVAAAASQMLLIPQPSLQEKPFAFRFLPRNLTAALGYVLQLLLQSDQNFGENLCRCQLESCGRFFLKRATKGRPGRFYCQPGHLIEAHKLDVPARVHRSRERKKAKRTMHAQKTETSVDRSQKRAQAVSKQKAKHV